MSRRTAYRIRHASSEQLLVIAVLGDKEIRRAVDRELDRRAMHQEGPKARHRAEAPRVAA